MKDPAIKYFSFILTWIFCYNSFSFSFSDIQNEFIDSNVNPQFAEAVFYFSSSGNEQSQRKENNLRPYSLLSFHTFHFNTLTVPEIYFTTFELGELSYLYFNYFLTSHFATSI